MRVQIFSSLSERDKRNIRLCCKQLKQEIDTLVGLNIKLRKPIKSNQLLEWIQSLRINEIDVSAENMTAWELMVLLQDRACLKSVHIWDPKNFELIPALTMLSALDLDNLRVLFIHHTCRDYLGFLPISIYRFAGLQKMHLRLDDISFDTAQVFCHVRCPQLQELNLSFTFDSKFQNSIVVDQNNFQKYFPLLLNMIEIFPSIRVLLVDFIFDKFTPRYNSDYENKMGRLVHPKIHFILPRDIYN